MPEAELIRIDGLSPGAGPPMMSETAPCRGIVAGRKTLPEGAWGDTFPRSATHRMSAGQISGVVA